VGYEVLGSDWTNSFQTPLATLHAFQGATDLFLVTPARGVEDKYAKAKYKFSGMGLLDDTVLSFMFHDLDSQAGNTNYGQEYDFKISRNFKTDYGKFFASVEFAAFDASSNNGLGYVDVEKTWLTFGVSY
jgi:hypothetical protein